MKELAKLVKDYKAAKVAEEKAKAEAEKAKAAIIAAMGGETTLTVNVSGVPLKVSNTTISTSRVDVKALREKFPQAAEACTVTTVSNRFTVR